MDVGKGDVEGVSLRVDLVPLMGHDAFPQNLLGHHQSEAWRLPLWNLASASQTVGCRGQVQSKSSLQIAALDCQPPSSTHLIQGDCTKRQASSRM